MPDQTVHSQRTTDHTHTVIGVVGDAPTARAVRNALNATAIAEHVMTAHRFAGFDAVVVAAYSADFGTRQLRDAETRAHDLRDRAFRDVYDAAVCGVERIVILSSAMMYGTSLHHPSTPPDTTRHPVLPPQQRTDTRYEDTSPIAPPVTGFAGDIAIYEEAFTQAYESLPQGIARPRVTILRPAALAGGDTDTLVTRHFEAPRLLVIKGVPRRWQFCHVDDLAAAVSAAVEHRLDGALTVGAVTRDAQGHHPDEATSSDVARRSGHRLIELSEAAAFGTAERLHRVGVLPAPSSDLSFAVYPWVVYPQRLLDVGWRPRYTTLDCVDTITAQVRGRLGVGGRRFAGRDAAALGAAGAAVAALATAAIWKQARGGR
ncbi:hypothetical protein [Jonesia quinghaiensis]|uniref:hypothetical protein n=1 Tax=Jonesia quinghaiensis TaxID=262806 RepID=UPI00040DBBDC|nr:hypothetical protein [Jonesia quinghaiensis]